MKRRYFLGLLAASGAAPKALGSPLPTDVVSTDVDVDVDPYFLQTGELPATDQAGMEALLEFQERELAGDAAVRPRGRPALAPTYRLLKWDGDLDGSGRFRGPLSVSPDLPKAPAYRLNAQILGFSGARDDWGRRVNRGTLTIEFRTRLDNEPMTWLFAQQFDIGENGRSTLSLEYVGQRDGVRDPIVTDDPNVDLRVQLIRHRGRAGLLRKILKIFSFVVGLPTAGLTGTSATLAQALPVIRVPRMLREGVAFSQAFFGGMTDESPVWRSGFSTFALTPGGSRLGLSPGIWVVIDEARERDLSKVVLADLGGRIGLLRNGEPIDANYLVLSIEAAQTALSGYGRVVRDDAPQAIGKGLPAERAVPHDRPHD